VGARGVLRRAERADNVDARLADDGITIGELGAGDVGRAGSLAALHRDAHDAGMALGMLAAPTAVLEREYVRTIGALDPQERILLVAEQDGEAVGMAQLVRSQASNARHRAEIRRVAVASSARGAGIGRRLMAAVEDAARAREISLLWLTTHAGTGASSFYASIGYTLLGVMPGYSARPDGTLADGAFFYRELA
jgi:GNAT superfamily N-acetyltransferase